MTNLQSLEIKIGKLEAKMKYIRNTRQKEMAEKALRRVNRFLDKYLTDGSKEESLVEAINFLEEVVYNG